MIISSFETEDVTRENDTWKLILPNQNWMETGTKQIHSKSEAIILSLGTQMSGQEDKHPSVVHPQAIEESQFKKKREKGSETASQTLREGS